MGLYEQWMAEKASDWTVEPSKVKLKPIGRVAKTFNDILEDQWSFDQDAEIEQVVKTWTDLDGIYADDVEKGNPHHDPKDGRFTTGPKGGAAANPMIRTEAPPTKTKIAYKVFVARDGKLYPPMVANPDGQDTPVGVWLNASEGKRALNADGTPVTNTLGRERVVAGGKGTQGGSGQLAYRPGWHLGEVPEAKQFYTKDKQTGEKKQKKNFVWAECEIAADFDYQEEAMSYGYNKNGKFQHSLAGLPKIPKDGYYTYRTNPDPTTKPWYITGAMKVNRILTDAETNSILRSHGIEPMKRDGGELDLKALGFNQTNFVSKSAPEDESVCTIFKTDEDKRLVFGWASISMTVDGEQLEDRQKDMIDPEDLEEAAYEYVLNFRDTGEEHISSMRKKGKLVESCVLTKEKQRAMGIPEGTLPVGWWVGFKIMDEEAWQRVKNGTYRMFSIEGKANREPVEKSDRFDEIEEVVVKADRVDHIVEVEKFNPYHGKDGRFASARGAASFTYSPGKSKAHDNAIASEKQRTEDQAAIGGKIEQVRSAASNTVNPLKRGEADIDSIMKEGGCDRETAVKAAERAKTVYEKAAAAEPQITADIVGAVANNNGKMYGLDHRMKSETSLGRKIASDAKNDFGGDLDKAASNIKDSVRYTAVFESKDFTAGYNNVKKSLLEKGYTEDRCKNFYESYRAGKSQQKAVQCVFTDKNGNRLELQFHTYESQGAKEVNHPLYEGYRSGSTKAAARRNLNKRMIDISSNVPDPAGVFDIKAHG